ncbi:MAG: M3 family oligoendopeptidase [Lachnospiraceae bacterium]|jgi:M3 family oligoendopeptidase
MKFSEIRYERPDVDETVRRMKNLTEQLRTAGSASEQIRVLDDYDRLIADFSTVETVALIRNSQDTRDAFYRGEQDYMDANTPKVRSADAEFNKVLMQSPYLDELKKQLGDFYFEKRGNAVRGMNDAVVPLMQKENALSTKYYEIYSSAQIPFQGRKLTVEQIRTYKADGDRAVRKAAWKAEGEFFDSHRAELDDIYDQMVKNRTEQAHLMGYKNFIDLGNIRMSRYGYGAPQVISFRRQVARDLVPLVTEMKRMQAERIGLGGGKWRAYDDLVMFGDGNSHPAGTPQDILEAGRKMFAAVSPETKEFYDFMMDGELIDADSRPGKAPGGYTASLENYKAPFIFSNFNGSGDDVEVLTHEGGHAFEDYTAARMPELSRTDREFSAETAECHSMSMEFLTQKWHRLFYADQRGADKYDLAHTEDALSFIPYACIVDAFQYSAYEHPEWTPEERNEEWKRLLAEFQPHLTDYEDIPFYNRGGGWQYKLHIYVNPLYYIDYALAEIVALQFFLMDNEDHEKAWDTYYRFVRQAGTMRFEDGVKAAGLRSPFEEGCVKDVAERVMDWIRAHQLK